MWYRFFQRNLLLNSPVRQLFFLEWQEFEKKTSKSSLSKRTDKKRSHFRVDRQTPANRNHAKIRNHRRTIARDVRDRTLFIPLYLWKWDHLHFDVLHWNTPAWLRTSYKGYKGQTSNKISNKLPARAQNKLLKTQAGDISPYFLRELVAIICVEHKCKIFLSLSRHIKKQLGKRSKNFLFARI